MTGKLSLLCLILVYVVTLSLQEQCHIITWVLISQQQETMLILGGSEGNVATK